MPPYLLTEYAGDERSDERAGVDAHVKNREAGIPSRSAFGIKVADDRGHVRLEQSRADDDEDQPDEERRLFEDNRQRDREVAECDKDSAVPDRASQTEPAISDPTTGQRSEINAGGVYTDDRRSSVALVAKAALSESGGHEQHEQWADSVVREPLPHLGEEERAQANRVTKKAAFADTPADGRWRLVVR